MQFKLKIKNKQDKILIATINAGSLEEAHEKVKLKGFEVVLENENDLMETLVLEPIVQKNIFKDKSTQSVSNDDLDATSEIMDVQPLTASTTENNIRRKDRTKNRLQQGSNHKTHLSLFYLIMALVPLVIVITTFILGYLKISFGSKSEGLYILVLITMLLCVTCTAIAIFHGMINSNKKIIWIYSVLIILNSFLFFGFCFGAPFLSLLSKDTKNSQNDMEDSVFGKDKLLDYKFEPIVVNGKIFLHLTGLTNSDDDIGPFYKDKNNNYAFINSEGTERIFKQGNDWIYNVEDEFWIPCKVANGDILTKLYMQ